MPFTQQLLLKIPTTPLALSAIAGSALLTILTTLLSHYIFSARKKKNGGPLTDLIFGTNSIIYSILLITVLVTAWLGFKSTQLDVQKEANCIIEINRNTEAFLPAIKTEIHALLEEYTKSIINEEWKTLARSEPNLHTIETSKKIWKIFTTYSPKDAREQVFLQESIRKLYELRENRATRIQNSKIGIYPQLWCVLLVGEVVTVFSLAFFSEDLKTKILTALLFGVLVGLIFFTMLLFDFPYTGNFTVSSDPLRQVLLYW